MDPIARRLIPMIGLLTLLLIVAACSSSGGASATSGVPTVAPATAAPASVAPASAAPASAGGGGDAVAIANFAFSPTSLTVKAGDTVTWTNQDSTAHTVTADDGSFDSKNVAAGASFSQTFATAGTFAYHCTIHPTMTATVVVQ